MKKSTDNENAEASGVDSSDLLSDLVDFGEKNQTLESILADGCYHGFGVSKRCPNEDCPEREVMYAWYALIGAAHKMRDQNLG